MSISMYRKIRRELRNKAVNAALRNKPTMWAYYIDMEEQLATWFSGLKHADGAFAGAALALSQRAVEQCPKLPPSEAARLWAMSVYARRILSAWTGRREKVSLNWLRNRVQKARAA